MTRRLPIILGVGAALLLLAEWIGPGGVQRRGMRAAEAFRQTLAPALSADPRFADVKIAVSTHPGLFVGGEVPDETARAELRKRVQAPAGAPFRVIFFARVREAASRPATKGP